ncbi:MAG: UDP-N-acetylmuramoyl-L-alanyl-D-glutamate--2,6-diaminopimelate ligase [Burkholderiaceae bacterium]
MSDAITHPTDIARWLRQRVKGRLLCDSRLLERGDGFVAWPGAATDGRKFVRDALAGGASAALVERDGVEAFEFNDDRVLAVHELKAKAGAIAGAYHDDPSASMSVVAITGTNGKTSTAWWVAQLLGPQSCPVVWLARWGGRPPLAGEDRSSMVSTGLTTPDPVLLQARLRDMVNEGLRACAIEASSIGLIEGRLNATHIRVAVFTNFTQDHLDFHGDMEGYWQAKQALFGWPGLAAAVVNLDDPKGVALHAHLAAGGLDLWTVAIGAHAGARLSAQSLEHTPVGLRFEVVERDAGGSEVARGALNLSLVGRYNVSNVLCAVAAARSLSIPLAEALQACGHLTPVPGRMERAWEGGEDEPLVLIDYAHTPDALEKALQALQPLAAARGGALWVVVGCGGDRDAGKRPLMAAVAQREAQQVVLTSDNPRSEDPFAILKQMVEGLLRPEDARVEVDRAAAIGLAVLQAKAADVVLIAGKGHEDYQEIQGVKRPFSDAAQAADALARRRDGQGVVA